MPVEVSYQLLSPLRITERSRINRVKKRLVILSTHPIQYHSPWFRALAKHPEIELEVWFCHNATPREQAEAGFGIEFDWDVSLLDGYPYRFLKNVAARPGVNSYAGLETPEL